MAQRRMTARLVARCVDANDPLRLARFWAHALRWEIDGETSHEISLLPTEDTAFRIVFRPVPKTKAVRNRIHLVGAVLMSDPDGNEFCVLHR